MALAENDIEERLLTLERKILRLRSQADAMNTWRISSVEQQLAALWMLPPRRVAQITGQIDGCASQGFPGATVRILNADGERLGTGVANSSGAYTALANLESDPQTVTVEATPVGTYAARFDGPATDSVSVGVGENTAPTIVIPPTEDWCCGETDYFPGTCPVAWKFRINGCTTNTGVPGAVIELYQGGILIDSCTTANGTGGTTAGECTMTVPTGSYDVVISGPVGAGFAGQSFTATALAGTTTRTLTADDDHVCRGTLCNFPFPRVLYTSDSLGVHTLTWNGAAWTGTYAYTGDVQFLNGGSCLVGDVMTVTYVFTGSTLSVNWRIVGCDCKYGDDDSFATVIPMCPTITASGSGTSIASFCATHTGTYNVPTTGALCGALIFSCSSASPGAQTPGGGGSMAVSP